MRAPLIQGRVTLANKAARYLWSVVWLLLFRPSPKPFHAWRCWLLKLFGAQLGHNVHPYPTAKIWAPWNLTMGDRACLADHVDCYCVAPISIGADSTISQYSFLCSATHDYTSAAMPLQYAPIVIGTNVWITADVFVGPGVTIGDGTVVTARSSVFSDLPGWVVASGNPATVRKPRELNFV